jgi:prepilin-type N-terminal cleavage/methylation domain-containing protein
MISRCPAGPIHRRRGRRGFTLIEVVFALTIFLMMAMVFSAVFPISIKAAKFSNNYNQAEELCQHKLDELREQPWGGFKSTTFATQAGANLVNGNVADSCSADANGDGGMTCSFVNIDDIADNGNTVGYFPAGSTALVNIFPIPGTPSYSVFKATSTISWTGGGLSNGSCSVSTVLIEEAHR